MDSLFKLQMIISTKQNSSFKGVSSHRLKRKINWIFLLLNLCMIIEKKKGAINEMKKNRMNEKHFSVQKYFFFIYLSYARWWFLLFSFKLSPFKFWKISKDLSGNRHNFCFVRSIHNNNIETGMNDKRKAERNIKGK